MQPLHIAQSVLMQDGSCQATYVLQSARIAESDKARLKVMLGQRYMARLLTCSSCKSSIS